MPARPAQRTLPIIQDRPARASRHVATIEDPVDLLADRR